MVPTACFEITQNVDSFLESIRLLDRAAERLDVPGVGRRFPIKMPPMSEEERYRKKAVEFAELAQRAASAADKAHMLRSAEAWLDRAKQSGRRIRNVGERPLIRAFSGR